jgi:hypothetical protein
MKVARQKLMDELSSQLQVISNMQVNGVLILPKEVNGPLTKNYLKLKTLQNFSDQESERAKELHVKRNPSGRFLTEKTELGNEWLFKSPEDRQKFIDRVAAWGQVEEEWAPFKVSEEDLLKVHNFPMQAFAALKEFECITELKLASPFQTPIGKA